MMNFVMFFPLCFMVSLFSVSRVGKVEIALIGYGNVLQVGRFLKCSHVYCQLELGKRCFLIDYPNGVCISVAMDMSNKSYLLVLMCCLSSCVFMKQFFNVKKGVLFN